MAAKGQQGDGRVLCMAGESAQVHLVGDADVNKADGAKRAEDRIQDDILLNRIPEPAANGERARERVRLQERRQ